MNSRTGRKWFAECVDRVSKWCETSVGAWAAAEAPAVATGMRDAVIVATVTEFGSPSRPNVFGGDWL
ncbi:hypothetical protein OG874_41645 [Nocardia sp. NBC_00565]|uniref:hypothetical protein n=1 Tax=Nocardia sp. NBC_00565 TaxID=2975993 RepID=UPI002E814F55|nr:hypothetical protein [Nocardia sp. NBC_00565]WUC03112.1 hypothetical protein OG874_41645 [Nocardia sp. NBC_00565]